jgi:hypothetical protein
MVVTFSTADHAITGVYAANNVNQSTPLRTAAKSSGSGTSVSNTVGSVATDDLVFDALCLDGGVHSGAVGADQAERWEIDVSGSSYNAGLSSTQLGAAGGVMSWTWTGSVPYSHVATAFVGTVVGAAPIPWLTMAPYRPA